MLAHEYDTMRSVEDRYWWYRVLRRMTVDEVSRAVADRPKASILDAGCGTGGTLDALSRKSPEWVLTGCDVSALAIEHARARGFERLHTCSVEGVPLPEESQDAVTCLDVLCHEGVDEDQSMQELRRVLRNGGCLVMNLPAFECLRGQHDVAVNGARRYTKRQVRELHSRNGFTVERVFCWNAWLFPPVWAWRQLSKRLSSAGPGEAKSDLFLPPEWLNRAVGAVAKVDVGICRALDSPIGTSVFSVARADKNS